MVSKFAACMWNLHQRGADKRANTHSGNGRVLEMLCMNWVSAGTFDDHEWASESTITQHVEEVMGMELDTKSVSHVWYNGACHGVLQQRGQSEHSKNKGWKSQSTTKL